MPTTLIHYAARAGDDSDGVMAASPYLAAELASRLGVTPIVIGSASPSENGGWERELAFARPTLVEAAQALQAALVSGHYPVIACSRCAVGLATLPAVAELYPKVVVVWFDAHADMNTPSTSVSGHLGGMALAGPLGLWDTGLGAGVKHVVLAGARDIDQAEWALIQDGTAVLVPPGPDFAAHLANAVQGRQVYVHVDCDVLSPGELPDDDSVPGGLTVDELRRAAAAIVDAAAVVVGVEIGELEPGDRDEVTKEKARVLIHTLTPLLTRKE